MNTYVVCGAPGMGKSPFIRKLIDKRRCLVFDVANEYGTRVKYAGQEPVNLPTNTNDLRSRYIGSDLKAFVEICKKKQNTVCVFEEATGFMQGRLQLEVTGLVINRYHTGNSYAFIFHSINSIPPRILEMCNYVVLFRTNDIADTVYRKAPRLATYWDDLQNLPNGESRIIKMI